MLWYQEGGLPQALPSVVYNDKNQSITNPSERSVEELNAWGWMQAGDVRDYNTFYYDHDWGGSGWDYIVNTFDTRQARIEAKKNKYISLLRTWYREARYQVILETESGAELPANLTAFLNDIQNEVARLTGIQYVDAGIDSDLSDMDSFATHEAADQAANTESLDFWYNYTNVSMPVQQRGGLSIFG